MPRIKIKCASEELLVEAGVVSRRSVNTAQIIGCIGCRWATKGSTYGYEVMRCTEAPPGTLYPVVKKLTNAGVIEREIISNPENSGLPDRILWKPSSTPLGQEFQAAMVPPPICELPDSNF